MQVEDHRPSPLQRYRRSELNRVHLSSSEDGEVKMQTKSAKRRFGSGIIHLDSKNRTGYRWIDKDPVIDEILALCTADGRTLSAIAHAAYLSPSTIKDWDRGKTRK